MMFPVIQSPCVFETLPSLNMFGFEQPVVAPVPKRRRGLGRSSGQYLRYMPSRASASLRYTVDESPEGYTLSLWKEVPDGLVAGAVESEVVKLKEESYRPNYHLVRDMWGNSYFLEEEADEEELMREAFSRLNMKTVSRKVARSLFQEYEIDLNHRGDELTVTSHKDGVSKAFEIGCRIDDVKVVGCKLNETLEYGILQIALVKSDECRGKTDNLARLIQWSQSQSTGNSEEEESQESEKARRAAEAEAQEAADKAIEEADIRAKVEAQVAAKLEAEIEARKAEEQRKKEEQQRNEEKERKQREAELRRRIAEEEREKRVKEEARRLKEQQLKEKKAFLIEQQRAKRLRSEQAKTASSPKTVTININFGNDDSNEREDTKERSDSLRRYQSPILEDVDDAEIQRFNESLSRSPQGSPILEEI
ncbi:hypothetical protein HG536_0D05180 [Torulaspora globosa]|uniref:Uncharacterized protein n=1 Tax=Torulaspora globosa TaxID=48254 RepID=A0A7G3ZHL0_9SACH|nr:uncharacterized protein HG536_0D05180 [Torulaspora globosa]QLL32996.1 hypothetical protein HG536_0D05180 [Torulaspora globosa]